MNGALVPNCNDVLIDRSNSNESKQHPGNVAFRTLISSKREDFSKASDSQRRLIVSQVYHKVLTSDPPGRFLTKNGDNWYNISTIQNTNAPSIRGHDRNDDSLANEPHPKKLNKDVDQTYNKSMDWTPLKWDEGKEPDDRCFNQSMLDALDELHTSVRQMDISAKDVLDGTDLGVKCSIPHEAINDYERNIPYSAEIQSNENTPNGNGKSIRIQTETKHQPWRTTTTTSSSSYIFPPLNPIAPNQIPKKYNY